MTNAEKNKHIIETETPADVLRFLVEWLNDRPEILNDKLSFKDIFIGYGGLELYSKICDNE